jgi:hypothetical protein
VMNLWAPWRPENILYFLSDYWFLKDSDPLSCLVAIRIVTPGYSEQNTQCVWYNPLTEITIAGCVVVRQTMNITVSGSLPGVSCTLPVWGMLKGTVLHSQ